MYKVIPIIHVLSKLGVLFSLLLLVPTAASYLFLDDAFPAFGRTAVVTIVLSVSIWLLTWRFNRELRPRDGFTLVFMLWVGFAGIAAMPFYIYFPQLSYTDAFFEAMSGLTTTGATVMTSLDTLAPSINFWRHMLNWLGGMGIIVLAVAVLPMLGVGGTQLFKAEIPGIDKDSKMAPRISQTAKKLWILYLIGTIITGFALYFAGMGWFDAMCHAMSAFSLGGFSTHDDSVGYFHSVPIESVLTVATLFGAISYSTHFAALGGHSLKPYWRDEECRIMVVTLIVSVLAVAVYLWQKNFYHSFSESLRYVGFNFVSTGLAGGYASTDFGQWPLLASLWMLFLANVLANSGSVGGGIKMARAVVLFKFSLREMMFLTHPRAVRNVKVNGRSISERMALAVMSFLFVYFMTIVLFTFIMMATGLDFIPAFTGIIACITNAGPGLGELGPAGNYAGLSDFQKWLCTFTMLLGRLEVFTVFILFTPAYWKK